MADENQGDQSHTHDKDWDRAIAENRSRTDEQTYRVKGMHDLADHIKASRDEDVEHAGQVHDKEVIDQLANAESKYVVRGLRDLFAGDDHEAASLYGYSRHNLNPLLPQVPGETQEQTYERVIDRLFEDLGASPDKFEERTGLSPRDIERTIMDGAISPNEMASVLKALVDPYHPDPDAETLLGQVIIRRYKTNIPEVGIERASFPPDHPWHGKESIYLRREIPTHPPGLRAVPSPS